MPLASSSQAPAGTAMSARTASMMPSRTMIVPFSMTSPVPVTIVAPVMAKCGGGACPVAPVAGTTSAMIVRTAAVIPRQR